ncbi:hypothetical protein ALC53_04082 [Atta colombica]|uniref:Uncharacterized protein n=1 Tax=Atta colombica TaxID=520822 RepID=A0A195BL37_9HYME|nr:hypothetical protein ALC53_04082 [Atta colombica]
MKLSVSAYTAQASAHKNLCSYHQQRSYGATNQASTARTPSDLATVLPALKFASMSTRRVIAEYNTVMSKTLENLVQEMRENGEDMEGRLDSLSGTRTEANTCELTQDHVRSQEGGDHEKWGYEFQI